MAKMGNALLRGVERNLRGRDIESHPARSGHLVWYDDLVAAAMVAPRLGSRLYCGFHAYGRFPCAPIACLGVCPPRKSEGPRRWDVARVPAGPISDCQNW